MKKIDLLISKLSPIKPIFIGGDKIDNEVIIALKEYKKQDVFVYFESGVQYKLDLDCPICKARIQGLYSKTYIFDIIYSEKFECSNCKLIKKEQQKKQLVESKITIKEHTENFIATYLNPEYSFKNEVKPFQYFQMVQIALLRCDKIKVFEYASKMFYYDFLKTPYWHAVRYKIIQKSNFKCSLCNSNHSLQVHHRSYENRGYEIDTQKDLICLCKNCHEKFHDIK